MLKPVFYIIAPLLMTMVTSADAQSFFGSGNTSSSPKTPSQVTSPVLSPTDFINKVNAASTSSKQQLRSQQEQQLAKLPPLPPPDPGQRSAANPNVSPATPGNAPRQPIQNIAAPTNPAPLPGQSSPTDNNGQQEVYSGFQTNPNSAPAGQSSGGWNIKY